MKKQSVLLVATMSGVLLALGCNTIKQSLPEPRDYSEKQADRVGAALATQPTGRDVDREGLQLTRSIASLSDYAIRIYENPSGQFIVNEKYTLATGQAVLEYLAGQDRKHLRHGVVYLISKSKVDNPKDFIAIRTFCIEHNVDLYIADVPNVRNIWIQGRPSQWDNASAGDVAWIIQARP